MNSRRKGFVPVFAILFLFLGALVVGVSSLAGGNPPATTVTFDNPLPSSSAGPMPANFQGMVFGGNWSWEGPWNADSTNNVFFTSSSSNTQRFAFVQPQIFVSVQVFADLAGTLTFVDDQKQSFTLQVAQTGKIYTVVTGWTKPSTDVSVTYSQNWHIAFDNFVYRASAATGPSISVVPSSASFGSVAVGTSNSQALTIRNSGTASLSVSKLSIAGAAFKLSAPAVPLTIQPGQSSAVTVQFSPAVVSSDTGTLTITANAPSSPMVVPLSGAGVARLAQITASPSSLSFGTIGPGARASLPLTLKNSGNSPITISRVAVTGTGLSTTGFTAPTNLAPQQATSLTVVFAPTSVETLQGTLSITSTATNSPALVSVSGVARAGAHQADLGWTASSSSVVGYFIYRGTQKGGPYSRLNTAPINSLSYQDLSVQSGATYYYIVTSVSSNGTESVASSEVSASIP